VRPPDVSNKLSLYDRAVTMLVVEQKSYLAVAKELGVCRRTLWRYRSDPVFIVMLEQARDDLMHAARSELQSLVIGAINVLRDGLACDAVDRDEAAKWTVRMQAAKAILERVGIDASADTLTDEQLEEVARRVGWKATAIDATPQALPSEGEQH
jgi:hypothetical protein